MGKALLTDAAKGTAISEGMLSDPVTRRKKNVEPDYKIG
jgi:hypothetical protein